MLCVAVGFARSFAFADDWAAFIPRPLENRAFVDVFTSYERDNIRSGTRPARWTDTFVREKFTLYSNGYSYHPRFLQYRFSLAGTGRQEKYDSSFQGSLGWRQASGLEYDGTLFFLPEHSYNLELFARRYEPLFKEQAATQHSSVETSRGAFFRYRKKPYFLRASYVNDSIESAESSSDVERFGLNGEYFKRYEGGNEFSFTGAFNPSFFSTSQGLEGSSTEYLLANFLNLRRVRLTSSLTKNSFDQESRSSQGFENDQFAWYELLTAYLPWNFRSDLSYRYQNNEGRIPGAGAAPPRSLSDKGKDLQFDVVHRLYESLDTTYTFLHNSRTSSGGETTALSQSLALNYTKSIPRGRVLAGINVARGETDNRGQVDVINEQYSATLPGDFILRQQNVAGNVDVFLQCPVAPFDTVQLVGGEGGNYLAVPEATTFRIHVISLPERCVQLTPDFVYQFLVFYSLPTGNFGLRTDTLGGNTSVQLFEDLLTPYFSYVTIKSEVVSGAFPGIPVDSTTTSTGLIVHLGPLRVRGEYQELQWEVSPYQAWRAEAQYVYPVNPTTSVYATASYLNKHFSRGTSVYYAAAFTEETESASGSIQKQFFSRNMSLSAGGSYSRMQGLVDANAYALNASWIWKIGKLDLTVGASAYQSDTTGTTTIATRRDHERLYVNLRRRLF